MSEDFSKMTDDELEEIVRLHENSNIPGSRFQRAMTELDLRYKKRGYKPGVHFEVGGDMTMEGSQVVLPEDSQMTAKVKGNLSSKKSKIIQGKSSQEKAWYEKPLGIVLLGVIIVAAGYIVTEGKLPGIFGLSLPLQFGNARVLDRSVFQLVADTDFANTPRLDVEQKWKSYASLITGDEQATIVDFGDAGLGKIWADLKSVNLYNNSPQWVTCVFGSEWQQRIQILGKNATTTFWGTISGTLTQGEVPILDSCSLR